MINVLRHLDALEQIDSFLPPIPFSPIEYIKLMGKKKQRSSRKGTKEKDLSACVLKMKADAWDPW